MRLNEKEQAYALALMEVYGATFDFYYRVDNHLKVDERRFNETTERVGLLEAINSGVRLELSEKIKNELSKSKNKENVHTYTEEEMAEGYAAMYNLNSTEEELWGGVTVEN